MINIENDTSDYHGNSEMSCLADTFDESVKILRDFVMETINLLLIGIL